MTAPRRLAAAATHRTSDTEIAPASGALAFLVSIVGRVFVWRVLTMILLMIERGRSRGIAEEGCSPI